MSKSVVEVVYVNGAKTYNTTYETSGPSKTIIIQDDDEDAENQFPSPRLCLIRKWPNFESGFGFSLYDDLLNSTGSLKIKNIIKNSPADVGGLKVNDMVIEVNGEFIEYKSFFHLIDILKQAFSRQEIELLVLTDKDAEWYRQKGMSVNSQFPNIQYCETPYYGFKFRNMNAKDLSSKIVGFNDTRRLNSHLSLKTEKPQTFVINTNDEKIYKLSKPVSLKKSQSLKNGLESDENHLEDEDKKSNKSQHGSPYNRSMDSIHNTDSLHDTWSEIMDKYLNVMNGKSQENLSNPQTASPRNIKPKNAINLNTEGKPSRSSSLDSERNKQAEFSFLYSGREDYQRNDPPTLYTNQKINSFSMYFFNY